MTTTLCYSICIVLSSLSSITCNTTPHIVLIIADDLGWSDVNFTNKHPKSRVQTSQSGVQTSQSRVQTSQSRVQTSQSRVETSQSGVETSQSRVQTSQSGVETSQSRVQTSQSRVQTSQSRVQTSQSGVESPETPNIDRLAEEGVIFDNFYTQSVCTPTRAALFTGKYPHKVGLIYPYTVLTAQEEGGVGTQHRLFTEELSDAGYAVHGVGKWHIGATSPHLPLDRGFNSFYGPYNGMIDYYTHRAPIRTFDGNMWKIVGHSGYNFHYDSKNGSEKIYRDIGPENDGQHVTDLFTNEAVARIAEHDTQQPLFLYVAYTAPHSALQPKPQIVESRNKHIKDRSRREYAALVTHLDDGVGEIVRELRRRHMWQNTVFIFMSDNGACQIRECWDTVGGSNLPYRDGKTSMFEGGIKSPAFLWSPWLRDATRGTRRSELLHVVDVFPFIMDLANDNIRQGVYTKENEGQSSISNRDGGDFIKNILNDISHERETIVHNIAVGAVPPHKLFYFCRGTVPLPPHYAVLRHRQYKLFRGLGGWCESELPAQPCPSQFLYNDTSYMLFDLSRDPTETVNIAHLHVEIVEKLSGLIDQYSEEAVYNWT